MPSLGEVDLKTGVGGLVAVELGKSFWDWVLFWDYGLMLLFWN